MSPLVYLDVVKVEWAGGGCSQAELVLLLANLKPLCVPVYNEAGDASVSLPKHKSRAVSCKTIFNG